ncbi:MAG: hypothetical protein J5806_04195 [Lentisphaeria bacterium]|nr:hypothetical protein [Lentisphaeria bacterium]
MNSARQQEVWFIDLSAVHIKAGSFGLRSENGEPLRFSLDKRYGPVHSSGKYVRPADGFYTKHLAPMDSPSTVQIGLISFYPPAGCRYCELHYTDGDEAVTEKPDPSLRPWWVELFKDPFLKEDIGNPFYSKAGKSQIVKKEQGFLFQKIDEKYPSTLFFYPGVLNLDARLSGRRLNAALCWESAENVKGNFSLPLRNGRLPQIGAINFYFQSLSGKYTGVMEGILPVGDLEWRDKMKRGSISASPGMLLREIHLQSLPEEGGLQLIPRSRSVYVGDLLEFRKVNFDREIFQKFYLDCPGKKVQVCRLLCPDQNRRICLTLTDRQGRKVVRSDSAELQIPKISPGEYDLSMEVFHGEVKIWHEYCKITVLTSPWE